MHYVAPVGGLWDLDEQIREKAKATAVRYRQAANIEAFRSNPADSYLSGPACLCLCANHKVWIQMLWGRPSGEDLRLLLASLGGAVALGEPHAFLLDYTGLNDITLKEMHRVQQFHHEQCSGLGRRLGRLALACPAEAAPFLSVSRAHPETRVFREFDGALDWLAPALGTERLHAIRCVRAKVGTAPSLLTDLRLLLSDSDLVEIDVARAARYFGMSSRSLQRALRHLKTSFRAELQETRLERARRKLRGDVSVSLLAYELGFQNVQAFIRAFRQKTGVTPGQWRRRGCAESAAAPSELRR